MSFRFRLFVAACRSLPRPVGVSVASGHTRDQIEQRLALSKGGAADFSRFDLSGADQGADHTIEHNVFVLWMQFSGRRHRTPSCVKARLRHQRRRASAQELQGPDMPIFPDAHFR